VLPVISYDDTDEVIERVNATSYGLGGSVWSNDPQRAYEVARRLDSGTVWINKHAELDPRLPFGGAKQSGLGVELGPDALAEYTQLKIINMAK
jgi:acyl-CoA reductase-like NAD-dependent aldehyde dehydrogenase